MMVSAGALSKDSNPGSTHTEFLACADTHECARVHAGQKALTCPSCPLLLFTLLLLLLLGTRFCCCRCYCCCCC